MQSIQPLRTALVLGAFALSLGLTSLAQAEGGDGFSGRYELFLQEEKKREGAQSVNAKKDRARYQKAGDVPVSPGAASFKTTVPEPYILDRRNQHYRGR